MGPFRIVLAWSESSVLQRILVFCSMSSSNRALSHFVDFSVPLADGANFGTFKSLVTGHFLETTQPGPFCPLGKLIIGSVVGVGQWTIAPESGGFCSCY
jgi:hypothetical protein